MLTMCPMKSHAVLMKRCRLAVSFVHKCSLDIGEGDLLCQKFVIFDAYM